jgi:hypothetical protein
MRSLRQSGLGSVSRSPLALRKVSGLLLLPASLSVRALAWPLALALESVSPRS